MRAIKRVKIVFISSLIVALFLSASAGFFIGKNFQNDNRAIPEADFKLFWQAYDQLQKNYLGEIDVQKYIYGAITGAYASVDDPYTTFFSPELTNQFHQELSGQLEGVGLKLGELNDLPTVISPIDGSPAQKAGIKTKDSILKVDDFETQNQPLDLVVSKIRGEAGTKVKLIIQLAGSNEIKEFELIREQIEVKTVEVKYQDETAIISLNEFGTQTLDDFEAIYKEASGKKINNLILDMRGNPGGLLDSAIQIAEYFLKQGQIIVIEESKNDRTEVKASKERGWQDINLVVLVDAGSASASEIVAGAMKENQRAKLIGEKTFGKGVVQQLISLSGGSSAKITISKWLTPKGTDIDKNGISPDIEAKSLDNQNFSNSDPVINKALEQF